MIGLPDIAVGAVAAALIAGLVSLLGLIVSKEQKVSEFRQAWIDALRSEISSIIAHANAIHGAGAASFPSSSEAWKIVRPDFVGINEAAAKVRLRLNPREPEAVAVLTQIEALEQLLSPGRAMDYAQINETEKRLVAAAQVVLKQEWVRVQRGERVYQIARFAALAVSAASVVALLSLAAARVAFDVWCNGDLDKLDAFIHANVVHHDPYDPNGAQGLMGMKKTIDRNRSIYPDMRVAIEDQLAEGNKVATRWTATMTHEGKTVTLTGITIDRFEGDKIVEAWRSMDMLSLLQQTGALGDQQ